MKSLTRSPIWSLPGLARGSVVVKIYLFAALALIGLGMLSFHVVRLLVDQGRIEALREIGTGQSSVIADEVASTLYGPAPAPEKLRKIGRALGARIQWVPWHQAVKARPQLRSDSVLSERDGRRGARPWRYWARIDRDGRPVGALRVEFRARGFPQPHRPWVAAGVTMGIIGLVTIPPLILWVVLPIRRMTHVANRLGEGRLDEPVQIDRRDEFGNLLRAFESLRVRILQMLHQRDRLLTDISHELRGPLSRMAIALPLIKAHLGGGHAAAGYVEQLNQDVATMDQLIGELLAYARGKSPQARQNDPLDLAELARGIAEDRQIVVEQRSLKLTSLPEAARVKGDARLLARAMGNLLDNALKYTPSGGHVEMATGVDGSDAFFRVSDDGPGIPEHDLPNVFEPFYRPDSARTREAGGTGLGLAIVQAVAESHGGRAFIRSGAGKGTVAELRLPAGT
ncbi:MAG: HAMP domain-containing histidine kinase [Candidatus Sericytochromatia bacterium]|nr:HAMP domain-containing histidine kinase [Candidatus Tanganyikabacteria bacterium]